jgi:aryl-alcohol dehydrogenase-like predicted oxidoreductase
MDKAQDLGVNFWDTADVYGWKKGEGVTEQIIGRYFAQGGGRRDRVILATKVYNDMDRPDRPDPNLARGLNARKIVRACEDSLRRLQTTWIDLYQMHHVDRGTSWDEIWQAIDLLVQQGKVLYVGTSNFAGWQIAQGSEAARRRRLLGPVAEQSLYNLTARTVELEVLPACQEYGLGVIPWSPAGGTAPDDRGVREALRRCRHPAGPGGAGLAADASRRDSAHHRAAHRRAADGRARRPGPRAR